MTLNETGMRFTCRNFNGMIQNTWISKNVFKLMMGANRIVRFLFDKDSFRHCLIEARYLHLELWLLLHFSQDPEMIEAISQNPNEPIKAIVGIMHKRPLNQVFRF